MELSEKELPPDSATSHGEQCGRSRNGAVRLCSRCKSRPVREGTRGRFDWAQSFCKECNTANMRAHRVREKMAQEIALHELSGGKITVEAFKKKTKQVLKKLTRSTAHDHPSSHVGQGDSVAVPVQSSRPFHSVIELDPLPIGDPS